MEYVENENGSLTTVYSTVNIEDIQVGDLVYSYDTITGEVSQKEVTDVFVRTSNHINYLTIIDENGNEQTIETTDSHPFWVVTDDPDLSRTANETVDENETILYHENLESGQNGFWVEAKDLQEGDVFISANGELSTLTNVVRVEQNNGVTVYHFTVDGNHDYFVIAKDDEFGQTCVLVHNAEYNVKHLPKDEVIPLSQKGNAPISIKDGKPVEIHHVGQCPNGPFEVMHPSDHRYGENFSKNHTNTGQNPYLKLTELNLQKSAKKSGMIIMTICKH
jgi:hypothetical protein